MFGRRSFDAWHAWVEERLSPYIDHQLASDEGAQLKQHLRECARCQASLASLNWTRDLLKQAPVPALPRSFVLPVPARRALKFGFAAVRLATAMATLLLFGVVGVDLITQLGGAAPALAPARAPSAQEVAMPTLAIAPAAQPTPTAPATPPPAPTPTLKPTSVLEFAATAAAPANIPIAGQTQAPGARGGGFAPEVSATTVTADTAQKSSVASTPAPGPPLAGAPVTMTVGLAVGAPTAARTATAAPVATQPVPSGTPAFQARAEPTRAALPIGVPSQAPRPTVSPLRVAEIGLFFLVMFCATLTFLLWRRR